MEALGWDSFIYKLSFIDLYIYSRTILTVYSYTSRGNSLVSIRVASVKFFHSYSSAMERLQSTWITSQLLVLLVIVMMMKESCVGLLPVR